MRAGAGYASVSGQAGVEATAEVRRGTNAPEPTEIVASRVELVEVPRIADEVMPGLKVPAKTGQERQELSEPNQRKTRVSVSKTEIQEGISAELFSICQGITSDGVISKDEIVALGLWLRDNRDADLPGTAFLSETLNRIIADGVVTVRRSDTCRGATR